MTIKVTFEFDTAADAAAFLQDFDGAPAAAGAEPAKRRGRPPKAATEAAASATAQTATPVQTPAPAAATVPFKAVADVITKLADADIAKAKAVLAQFGVAKASDLKPEQFGAVVEAAEKALNPPQAAATSLI